LKMVKSDIRANPAFLKKIQAQLAAREKRELAQRATLTQDAVRRSPEEVVEKGYRQDFSLDVDRILHSRAYTRYIDKTQVFYLIENDHITHRVLHVQLVSKIARTIGRFLLLNEDLIEAIALGHDIGHAPFGHDGETHLSALCKKHGIGAFLHNIQSVVFLDKVEREGRGWNLTLQTLDGILCHDGEVHNQKLAPESSRTFDDLEAAMQAKKLNPALALIPMTAEGCVVRMADTIAYIGRDIEDAIRLSLIKRDEIPARCTRVLGSTNGTIVHNLVTDIIENSVEKPHIGFSPQVSEALFELKKFNLERVYTNPGVKSYNSVFGELFECLFEQYLEDVAKNNEESVIFTRFLAGKSREYVAGHKPEELVRDFIAGMTDRYFLAQCPKEKRPARRRMP